MTPAAKLCSKVILTIIIGLVSATSRSGVAQWYSVELQGSNASKGWNFPVGLRGVELG
jgi:hypothetical protein